MTLASCFRQSASAVGSAENGASGEQDDRWAALPEKQDQADDSWLGDLQWFASLEVIRWRKEKGECLAVANYK